MSDTQSDNQKADALFVREAARKWDLALDYANRRDKDARDGALGIALWATVHVDRLIAIAGKRAKS